MIMEVAGMKIPGSIYIIPLETTFRKVIVAEMLQSVIATQ
jgi:hypothetical protein